MIPVFVKVIFNIQYSHKAQIHDKNSGLNIPLGHILVSMVLSVLKSWKELSKKEEEF